MIAIRFTPTPYRTASMTSFVNGRSMTSRFCHQKFSSCKIRSQLALLPKFTRTSTQLPGLGMARLQLVRTTGTVNWPRSTRKSKRHGERSVTSWTHCAMRTSPLNRQARFTTLIAEQHTDITRAQPKATISTVSNLASTTLESALPTTMSIATLLAPEEIHAAPLHMKARSELTPQEKRALRTKERKTRKKRRDAMESAVGKFGKGTGKAPRNVKEAKGVALNGLVKTGKGVTVIGKGKREDRSAPKKGTRTNGDGRQWKL